MAHVVSRFRSHESLRLENMALHHQLAVYRQTVKCPKLRGSIRRNALDHVIVLNEQYLRRVLRSYLCYYHHWRTHRSLELDAPETRPVQPPEQGPIRKLLEVGGLHHHYERIAA